MDSKKERLILSAAQLYYLGMELEQSKDRIKMLVAAGVDSKSDQMRRAVNEYVTRKQNWERLEQAHLKLRDEITGTD